jgi:Calcium binding
MAKHKIDQAREERIETDIVVDCYNEFGTRSAWICDLEDELEFPFRARCVAARKSSRLKSGEKVEIVSMLDENCDEPSEIFVQARWQGRELGLPLAQLEGIGVSNQTAEAIAGWHYWRAHGYSF